METIICALISAATTLVVSIGTWHVSIKKDREKAKDELKQELIKYHEKNREEIQNIRDNDLREIRDDLTSMGANLQQKIAVIDEQIRQLSDRVEKHNGVIERMYRCEERLGVAEERQRVANHRLDDLEHKVG